MQRTLTVKEIENLRPAERKYERGEGNGFLLRVLPSGRKFFYFTYTYNTVRRKMSLGEFPHLSLKEARNKVVLVKKLLANGIDPLESKKETKQQIALTVEYLGKEFVNNHCKEKRKSWKEDERILNTYILQIKIPQKKVKPVSHIKLHKMMVKDVRRRHIKKFCEDIANNRGKIMANRVFSFIRTMFSYAVENEMLEFSPCVSLRNPGGEERKKERYLRDEEIKIFWKGLDDSMVSSGISKILKLILLTGQRPSEICGIVSDEINDRWLTISGERTKNGRNHSVYLTDLAIKLIGDADGPKFISPTTGKVINRHQLSQVIRRKFLPLSQDKQKTKHIPTNPESITYPKRWDFEKFTPHDLRRTCATHLVGLGFNQLLVGHILNHTDQSVTAIYNQYSYDKEKQEAMEAWEQKITTLVGLGKEKTKI